MEIKKDWLKFIFGWTTCFVIRLVPFRPPNMEPILTTTMPFSKNYGWKASFVFAFFSIALFDMFTQKLGVWTLVTGVTYGLLGVTSFFFFRNRKSNPVNYLKFSIIGTLLYDAITGLTIGPLVFGMPFMVALTGQIPFTASHLLSNIVLSLTLSPLLHKWVVTNKKLSFDQALAKQS